MKKIICAMVLTLSSTWAAALDIERWHTENGVQVLLVQRTELPIVDFAVVFKGAGSTSEPAGKSDTATAAAGLALRGTQSLDEEQFMQKVNELGSSLSGSSSLEYSVFSFRSLSESAVLTQTVDLFADALRAPRYDERVLERVKDQTVQSLKQAESYPDFLTARARTRLNYPDHPYGKSALRTEATIRAVSIADLLRFHDDFYAQNQAVVAIVGDISRTQAEDLVAKTVGILPAKAHQAQALAAVAVKGGQIERVPFSGSQDTISLSLPVLARDNPDYFALLVGNYILGGGGFDSRLMKVLRDEKGFTYGAYSQLTAYVDKGPLTISFSTERGNTEAALAATQKVLADFVAQGPSEAELKQAQDNITGSFPLRLDTNGKLLGQLIDIGIHNRPSDWLDTYNDKIRALSVTDIRNAWQRHVAPEQMNIVITGGQ